MTEKLLLCPFCGGEPFMEFDALYPRYEILCYRCQAGMGSYRTEEEVIDAWNKRTNNLLKIEEDKMNKIKRINISYDKLTLSDQNAIKMSLFDMNNNEINAFFNAEILNRLSKKNIDILVNSLESCLNICIENFYNLNNENKNDIL